MKFETMRLIAVGLLLAAMTAAQSGRPELWLTTFDQKELLSKQPRQSAFENVGEALPTITVDEKLRFQTMDGFGFTLTGGSAQVLNRLNAKNRSRLLKELFGSGSDDIGISYLRISIGASDLNTSAYSYNDLRAGETDVKLNKFSLGNDEVELIPLLNEILRINPKLLILASPWSAPPWMKDNGSFIGGRLQPKYYGVYARYFVKYVSEMERRGVRVDAITVQNEPLHDGNEPSMLMSAAEQADFVANHLGPAFTSARLATKIVIYDHNCDKPEYPLEVLGNSSARKYIDGTAFHLYAGEIGCLSRVREVFPEKNLYFTEQYTASTGTFAGDFRWHMKNLIIGAPRNWSKTVLEWNLASDASFKPHTPGGCAVCKGGLTIDDQTVTRNVGYYIIAQASKFVPNGSVRIASTGAESEVAHVAYATAEGKIVLIVLNESGIEKRFNIAFKNKKALATLPAGSAGTFLWK